MKKLVNNKVAGFQSLMFLQMQFLQMDYSKILPIA